MTPNSILPKKISFINKENKDSDVQSILPHLQKLNQQDSAIQPLGLNPKIKKKFSPKSISELLPPPESDYEISDSKSMRPSESRQDE